MVQLDDRRSFCKNSIDIDDVDINKIILYDALFYDNNKKNMILKFLQITKIIKKLGHCASRLCKRMGVSVGSKKLNDVYPQRPKIMNY